MRQMFEATWSQGEIIPKESINIRNNARLMVIVLDDQPTHDTKPDWRKLKGKYKGKLSAVDEFIRLKQTEKRLEL